ncbi:membrane cofactor protein-like isoform X10 [Myotis myotis]|uniref:membrane cofactor protein-like isoform X10 n=1 Tax=Myotis myotis TaxID=51298 RepID=UPI001747F799|nr:membrane cofactor protein-like isoform X10 [Myotis myotis]XP_036200180.1 membrane cofactor protein-like isoform X10 [Myotis myotis]
MTASRRLRAAPPRRPFSSWSSAGILLVTLALRFPAPTDACDEIPKYDSMKARGNPVPPVSAGFAVEYECRPGYRLIVPFVRPTTTVCQPDGTWAPPRLQEACTRRQCPQLAESLHGRVEGNFQFGSQANYSCDEGYYLVGTPVLRCVLAGDGNNVAWSGDPPQCEKILCQPPPQIEHGIFSNSHKDTFEYNEMVTYHCNPSNGPDEYSLVGGSRLICSGPNKWSSDPPECKVVKCPYPSLPDGTIVSGFGKKYYYKAGVEFECNQGYSLQGSRKIVCEADNTWVPEIPRCVQDACDEIPRYDSMKGKGNPVPPVSAGFAVEYECRPGYRLIVPLVRPTSAVCQSNGTWAPPLQEACTRKSCPQLAEPLNGRVEGNFQFGSQASYSCNEGYNLVGTPVLHCELAGDGNNVAWSGDPPQCEKILCQPPPQIGNGTFSNSHKDTFEYGEVVTYRCNPSNGPDEYSLVGKSTLSCSGPNKWSSDPPECKVVKCPYPSLPDGTIVSGFGKKYYYKAEVEFECNQGYSLQGSRKIVCEADNTWVPEIPRCLKVVTSPPSTTPPILSPSVSTPPSTKPPISSVTGVTPSPSTKPPVSSSPGHPPPDETPSQSLGAGAIVGITLAVVVVSGPIALLVYYKKKRKGLQKN